MYRDHDRKCGDVGLAIRDGVWWVGVYFKGRLKLARRASQKDIKQINDMRSGQRKKAK